MSTTVVAYDYPLPTHSEARLEPLVAYHVQCGSGTSELHFNAPEGRGEQRLNEMARTPLQRERVTSR